MSDVIIAALIASVVPVIMTRILVVRETKNTEKVNSKLDHIIVVTNSKLSEALKRIEELEEILKLKS